MQVGRWVRVGLVALFATVGCAKNEGPGALPTDETGGESTTGGFRSFGGSPTTGGARSTGGAVGSGGGGTDGGATTQGGATPGGSGAEGGVMAVGGTLGEGGEAGEGGVSPIGGGAGAYSTGLLTLHYTDRTSGSSGQQLSFVVSLENEGDDPIDLSAVTIRYWFTDETGQELVTEFDYVSGAFESASNVNASFGEANYADASHFVEFGFEEGWLVASASTESTLQVRIHTEGYRTGTFNQSNDYSFGDADRIAVYVDGVLVWGVPPEGIPSTGEGGAGGAAGAGGMAGGGAAGAPTSAGAGGLAGAATGGAAGALAGGASSGGAGGLAGATTGGTAGAPSGGAGNSGAGGLAGAATGAAAGALTVAGATGKAGTEG